MTEAQTAKPHWLWGRILFATRLATAWIAFCSLAPFAGRIHWTVELLSHYPAFYLGFGIIFVVILAWFRSWRWIGVAAAIVIVNGVQVGVWYLPVETAVGDGPVIRVMLSNVLTENTQYARVIERVREVEPDIFVAQEINFLWKDALAALDDEYPHQYLRPRRHGNFGMGVYSRIPLLNARHVEFGGVPVPVILADIKYEGAACSLIALHTLPPGSPSSSEARNLQLAHVPNAVEDAKHPVLLVGDINTTMWSPYYKEMVNASGLKNARAGRGIHASWPIYVISKGPFLIPIDHILYEPPIAVKHFNRLERIGGDHLPVMADVVLDNTGV